MTSRFSPAGAVIRALFSTLLLMLLVSISSAQSSIGGAGGTTPSIESKAPAIKAEVAKVVVNRIRADHPELDPLRILTLLQQDLARDGYYSSLAAGMIGGLYLTTNEKLALLFLAGVVVGVLLM